MALFRLICLENRFKDINKNKIVKIIYLAEVAIGCFSITIAYIGMSLSGKINTLKIVSCKLYLFTFILGWKNSVMYKFCQDEFKIINKYENIPIQKLSKLLCTFQLALLQVCFVGEVIVYIKVIKDLRKNDEGMAKWLSDDAIKERRR